MNGLEIAQLFASVGADVSDFDRASRAVKDDLTAMERGFQGLQNTISTSLKAGAMVATAAITGLAVEIGHAVNKAADMEQGIQNIAASMQLGSEETAQLKDLIMDLGLDPNLAVTATEAAQAIEVLGTAGLTMDEILQGAARSTVLLANSTGADFADAGAIATDVMAQFNIKAADMAAAVDQITGVTVASKFTINDYQLALAQAGGVAGSVGVEFDDFNAVIAAISPNFASGSDAGTSFKTLLQTFIPKSNEAEDAMRALGLITADGANQFFTASNEMKSMSEIAGVLNAAFSGLSEQQRIEAASTIFGTDAMRAAFGLIDAGTPGIEEMKRIIGDTSAEESAAKRMDSLRGSWQIFTGVVETLQIGIGDRFLPVARRVIEWATELSQRYGPPLIEWAGRLAQVVADAVEWVAEFADTGQALNDKLTALPEPIQAIIRTAAGFIDKAIGVIDVVSRTIGRFVDWQDILIVVGGVVASMVIPALGSVVAAAAPVVAIFDTLAGGTAILRGAWDNDFGGIQTKTQTVLDYVGTRFGTLGATIQDFGVDALREIGLWATGQETDFTAVNRIVDATQEAFGLMWDDFAQRFPETAEVVNSAWIAVSDATKTAWEYVTEKSAGLVEAITTFGVDSLAEIVKWATGNETEFTATKKIWQEFGLMAGDVGGDIMEALRPVSEWMATTFPRSAKATADSLAQLEQAWRDLTGQTEESAKKSEEQMGGLMETITALIDTGLAIALSRVSTFVANFGQMFVALDAASTGDWEAMWAAIEQIQANTDAQMLREAEIMVDALTRTMEQGGEDMIGGFNRGLENALPRTRTKMDEFANEVGGPRGRFHTMLEFGSPSRLFERFGGWTIEGFMQGVNNALPTVEMGFNGLGNAITNVMTTVTGNVANTMDSTIQSIVEGVRYGAANVNLAVADVIHQSAVAEAQARTKWEQMKRDAAAAAAAMAAMAIPAAPSNAQIAATIRDMIGRGLLNPAHFPTYMGGTGTQTGTGPGGEIILAPTPSTPGQNGVPLPPTTPFNDKFLMGALQSIFPTQDISESFGNIKNFSRTLSMTLDNAILSGNLTESQLTEQEQRARQVGGTPQDYAIEKLLDSIQLLIQTIATRGLGSNLNFDISQAPANYQDNRTELQQLVQYLSALYA